MKRFLFQGDSITDCERTRAYDGPGAELGQGYATMAAGQILSEQSGNARFLNRAVSGDCSKDLYARVQKDVIDCKPDILSVLIGVNDVWHEIDSGTGCTAEQFEQNCRKFYEAVKGALPQIQIFVLEPFVGDGPALRKEEGCPFRAMVEGNARITKIIAEEYGLIFVPLQEQFDIWTQRLGVQATTLEGVHPTLFGHTIIANALCDAVRANVRWN